MVLGIAGNIASGKSTVAELFQELGSAHISADQIARDVVTPGSDCFNKIVAHFGQAITNKDGTLNRDKLGSIVFTNKGEREVLNAITHPAIAVESMKRINELQGSRYPLIVYEAPLLFEAGAESRVDEVLTVTIPIEIQFQRLMKRDNISHDEARARIESQMPQGEKVRRADYVLENRAGVDHLKKEVIKLFNKLTLHPLPNEKN